MNVGKIIIRTIIKNDDFEKGLNQLIKSTKSKGKTIAKNIADSLSKGLSNALKIGGSLLKVVGKIALTIGKLAIGLVAVGTVVGLIATGIFIIGKAFKQAITDNEQLRANLDYMKFAITQALQPAIDAVAKVIEKIVNFLIKIVQYIGYIISMWKGRNIFESAGVDAYAESLKKAEKNQKALNKQTAKFDEMNVMQDKTSGNTSSAMPSIDFSQGMAGFQEGEAPWFLDWIVSHKDEVIGAIAGITGAFISLKLLGLNPIESSGVFLLIYGLYNGIKDLIDIYKKLNPELDNNGTNFKDWGDTITDVGLVVLGLGIIIGGLPLIIAGVITAVVGLLMTNWNEIKTWFKNQIGYARKWFDGIFQWLLSKIDNTENNIVKGLLRFVTTIYSIFLIIPEVAYGIVRTVGELFEGLFTSIKNIFDGILLLFKGEFKQGFINIGKGIVNALITVLNTAISLIATVWDPIIGAIQKVGNIFGFNWDFSKAKLTYRIPYLEKGGLVNNPGHGVMMGSYIAGERGQEAVIPLDDQTLDRLGLAFARHTVINANIVNNMNGRVISRELKKINAEENFAFNG